jgi:hypothetical protein
MGFRVNFRIVGWPKLIHSRTLPMRMRKTPSSGRPRIGIRRTIQRESLIRDVARSQCHGAGEEGGRGQGEGKERLRVMKIRNIEILSAEQMGELRHLARAQRREESRRFDSLTIKQLVEQSLDLGLSEMKARERSPVPEVSDWGHENDPEGIRGLLCFALNARAPVLVEYERDVSKAFEERLRWAAKPERICFYRLLGSYAILDRRGLERKG